MKEKRGIKVYLHSFLIPQYVELSGQLHTQGTISLEETKCLLNGRLVHPRASMNALAML